jgi:hypothetical protein
MAATEEARHEAARIHVERGIEHVRNAQTVLGGPFPIGSKSRQARAWRELNAAASQFETVEQIMDGRLPVEEPTANVVTLPVVRQPSAASTAHRLVAERRVIVNLGYPEGLAVLKALERMIGASDVKASLRDRLLAVHAVLEPRVARARRARRVAA